MIKRHHLRILTVAFSLGACTGLLKESPRRTVDRASIRAKQGKERKSLVGSLVNDPVEIDGATLTWTVGGWGDCSNDCGPGGQSRSVACFNNDMSAVVPDSVCLGDAIVGPAGKPATEQDCMGPCITCTDRNDLFSSAGLSQPPVTPVKAASNYVCNVTDSSYSCCDRRVENSIVTQVIAINKGFGSIPGTAGNQSKYIADYVLNSTAEFTERLQDTESQLGEVQALLDQASNLKMDKRVNRALTVTKEVLTNRVSDLKNAISNSTLITSFLQSQLSVLSNDTSMSAVSANRTNLSPRLSDCANATVDLFSSLSCASCSPSFVTNNVNSFSSGLYGTINVSSTLCETVFKQCAPTIRSSRRFLEQALRVMRSIHSQLARSAARLQPALAAVWSSLSFDWLPAATHPTKGLVPDISSLDCIKSTDAFELGTATSVSDFCANFFDSWNYQLTINNLVKDLKVGVQAMDSLQRCDKCVHLVLTKLTQMISSGSGQVDVTLSLSPSALEQAGCFGLSSSPSSVKSNGNASSSSVSFSISDDEVFQSSGERMIILKKSKRAISFLLNMFTQNTSSTTSAAPYVRILQYTADGTDPSAISSVNWDVIGNASNNPPPSIWSNRSSAEVPVIATEMNCTTHMSCNPDGGDSPYWFCGTKKLCENSVSCDEDEKALLDAHPRCVKGLCVDDKTAVDGKCPDIAVCPVTKIGQFDHTYFSRYRSIAPIEPPSASLVASQGASKANAITQAANYAKGVCDCAFYKKTDQSGDTQLGIGDTCFYAQCLAYALANEKDASCTSGLLSKCQELQSGCPDVVCDKVQALWNAPSCDLKTDKTQDGFALSSDTRSAAWTSFNALLSAALAITLASLA